MKKSIIPFIFALAGTVLTGCDDVFEPAPENNLPIDYIDSNPTYAENMLGNVYIYLPNGGSFPYNEVATDDAVTNDATSSWRRIASGAWSSALNPANRWEACRMSIQYCNLLLSHIGKVKWAADPLVNELFDKRYEAEALALRAINTYFLLEAHAGYISDGRLLGIPLVTEPEDGNSNFNLPRNTFMECVQAIKDDAEAAMSNLPTEYGPEYYNEMRNKYPGITDGQLERVFGSIFYGRVSGRIIEAFLARLALLAASPAYSDASGMTWAEAADLNAKVLDRIGGVYGLDQTGNTWYCATNIKDLKSNENPAEILWRSSIGSSRSLEEENFPPTLYGRGRINPTQNLVDAFPMASGYPISEASDYDPANPYAGRDPRLSLYILCNGMTAGTENKTITTAVDGSTDDALNKISSSTRTGYYMKKHLRQDVNCNPSSITEQSHYHARLRYTEFFLNYAEAANEAWGPTGTGSHSYSAYDVIKEIRLRAGIGLENGDEYLESVKGDKDAMRKLIRNERRLELCFEGFRFYDLRRWKEDLNATALGVSIQGGVPTVIDVESRNYGPHMYYGPIPYTEVLKFSELQQNAGW